MTATVQNAKDRGRSPRRRGVDQRGGSRVDGGHCRRRRVHDPAPDLEAARPATDSVKTNAVRRNKIESLIEIGQGHTSIDARDHATHIQQVDGGDEWLTIRHGMAFESITFGPCIEDGTFASLVRRLLAASKEQCEMLRY